MTIQSLQRLQAIAANLSVYEDLKKVTVVPPTLEKSFTSRKALVEAAVGPIVIKYLELGTTVVGNAGGLGHKTNEATTVKLFRATFTAGKLEGYIEWKQGVISMNTAWYIKIGEFPKVVFPSNKWESITDRLKNPVSTNSITAKKAIQLLGKDKEVKELLLTALRMANKSADFATLDELKAAVETELKDNRKELKTDVGVELIKYRKRQIDICLSVLKTLSTL
jgi:hypothetical protein